MTGGDSEVGTCQLSLQIKQVGQQCMIVNISTEQTANVRILAKNSI